MRRFLNSNGRIDFERLKAPALANAEAIVRGLLPDGHLEGSEWSARNPRRDDRRLGSFKANLRSGEWCDFATGDRGSDLVALWAYVMNVSQRSAAIQLAGLLGIDPFEGGRS